jgi:hypothetical protein
MMPIRMQREHNYVDLQIRLLNDNKIITSSPLHPSRSITLFPIFLGFAPIDFILAIYTLLGHSLQHQGGNDEM